MRTSELTLGLLFLTTACQQCEHKALSQNRQLYVMIGDSQMVGQGELAAESPDPHVFMFGWDNQWKEANEPTSDTAGTAYDFSAGYSCGVSFGKAMRQIQPSQEIGIIPCGHNGSTVVRWLTDGIYSGENAMYTLCINRIRQARQTSKGDVMGVIIHLGTNDAFRTYDASGDHYAENFGKLVAKIRSDLGSVSIVFAELGQTTRPDAVDWALIQAQQRAVSLSAVGMITTDDLTLKADGVHLDALGERMLGERFARGMSDVNDGRQECSVPWYARLIQY